MQACGWTRAQVAQLRHIVVGGGGKAAGLRGPLLGVCSAAVEVERRLAHLEHLHDTVLLRDVHGAGDVRGPRKTLGALPPQSGTLSRRPAADGEPEFFRHLRAQRLLRGTEYQVLRQKQLVT